MASITSSAPALRLYPSACYIPQLVLCLKFFGTLEQSLQWLYCATRKRLLDISIGQITTTNKVPALAGTQSYTASVPCMATRSLRNFRGSPTTSQLFIRDRVFKGQQLPRTVFSATVVKVPTAIVLQSQPFLFRFLGTYYGKECIYCSNDWKSATAPLPKLLGIYKHAHIKSFSKHRSLSGIFQLAGQQLSSLHSKLSVEALVSTLDICGLVRNRAVAIKHSPMPKKTCPLITSLIRASTVPFPTPPQELDMGALFQTARGPKNMCQADLPHF